MNIERTKGIFLYAAVLSLVQDFKYKTAEGYADAILHGGWIDRSITIPVAIIILIIIIGTDLIGEIKK